MKIIIDLIEESLMVKELPTYADNSKSIKRYFDGEDFIQVTSKKNLGEKQMIKADKLDPFDHILLIDFKKYHIVNMFRDWER